MTTEQLGRLAPHMSACGLDGVRTLSRNLSIPKTVIATMANWLHWEEEPLTEEQHRKMELIPTLD
jgi:hypothetical protein